MDRVCPLLGLQGDRRSAIDGIDPAHRCHADDPPITLDRHEQVQICLTRAHERCPRFLAAVARRGGVPGQSTVAGGLVSTRMVLAPEPAWRGIAGRAPAARSMSVLAAGAALIALGVGGVALVVAIVGGRFESLIVVDASRPSPSATTVAETPSATPRPTPRASPTPTPTPLPTSPLATPTPAATIAPPTPTAVPPPPPQQTYVVQAGDTLGTISALFGTTVAAIQEANGIVDPNTIVIGQVLVIP